MKRDCNGKSIEIIEGHYLEVVVLLYLILLFGLGILKEHVITKFNNTLTLSFCCLDSGRSVVLHCRDENGSLKVENSYHIPEIIQAPGL